MSIKSIPDMITMIRIIGSVILLTVKPLDILFFLIYALCVLSDVMDGYLARKAKACTARGAVLDSIADTIFFFVMLIIFIPVLSWTKTIIIWIASIAFMRILSLIIGFVRYHKSAMLHTYLNKLTGFMLSLFPVIYVSAGVQWTMIILCVIASAASIEELIINIFSKKLDRNIVSIFKI